MVGARRIHGETVGNLFGALKVFLRGKRCRPYSENMKLVVDKDVFYPDVFVTCDDQDLSTDQVFRHPTFICEVLSPSTETFDRGLKFAAYRRVVALKEYLLLDPESREITLFRKNGAGLFVLHDFTQVQAFDLESLGCRLSVVELFENAV
jgi:Uma2 family endonuclease